MYIKKFILFTFSLFFFHFSIAAEIKYDVEFEGETNKEITSLLQTVSQLVILKDQPPVTLIALKRRAEADIPNILEALHSTAHYEAKVKVDIDKDQHPILVIVHIELGPVYPLASFKIEPIVRSEANEIALKTIFLKDLDVTLGKPALPKTILSAEKKLLRNLAEQGFPLAVIEKREVSVDVATKNVHVLLRIDTGPHVKFGEVQLSGLNKVQERFIKKKIYWQRGAFYDPCLVEGTQSSIESSGLFSSVLVTSGTDVNEQGEIPVVIEVHESKHRSIGFGASYNTQLGLGGTADWEHRNIRGCGEKLSLRTDIWEKLQRGVLLYRLPDFRCPSQDFLWILEGEREITKGFKESFFSASGIIEKKINENTQLSYGGTFKQLDSEDSNHNGSFSLLKVPFQLKWSDANNLLDPSSGHTIQIKITPTVQLRSPQFFYSIHNFTASTYFPLDLEKKTVLALKMNIGSIWGTTDKEIPPPERFYAGSENTLRGYGYLTVSPLNHKHKPIGGRSLMIYSIELRRRITEKWSLMGFYEVGNVYKDIFPRFDKKQLQSTGFGVRYHTAVGPLRLDFAFPLNRRKKLDRRFQFYLSIGQAF